MQKTRQKKQEKIPPKSTFQHTYLLALKNEIKTELIHKKRIERQPHEKAFKEQNFGLFKTFGIHKMTIN